MTLNTTASELDHYFGNCVGYARLFHIEQSSGKYLHKEKEKFVSGLEKALVEEVSEEKEVTREHLREMIRLAKRDWSDVETIKSVYKRYFEIRGTDFGVYDEGKLFHGR